MSTRDGGTARRRVAPCPYGRVYQSSCTTLYLYLYL